MRSTLKTVVNGIFGIIGALIVLTAIFAYTNRRPKFVVLHGQEPIIAYQDPSHKKYVYSFPVKYFSMRELFEAEMRSKEFRTISQPSDIGRWWEKGGVKVMLSNGQTTPDGSKKIDAQQPWKWATVHVFVSRDRTWLDRALRLLGA